MDTVFQAKDLLNVVALFANAVQSNEGPSLTPSQIWSPLGDGTDTSIIQDDSLTVMFRNPRECLSKYENMLSLFRNLTASLEHGTMELKKVLDTAVRSCGINKLPNEILLMILEDVVSTYKDARTLMCVSVRFRDLVMSSPRLWAACKLDLSTPPDVLSFISDMSRGMPLTASLVSSFTDEEDLSAAARIFNYRSSLGKLSISEVDCGGQHEPFKGIQLPILNELSIRRVGYHHPDDRPTIPFYDTWEMPRLYRLETNFPPAQVLGKSIVSFHCCLTFEGFRGEMNDLLQFLASCPSLESLHIGCETFVVKTHLEEGGTVVLPKLKSLSLEASLPEYLPWLVRVLERVAIDNVSAVNLTLHQLRRDADDVDVLAKDVTVDSETEAWGPVIVSRIASLPRLQKLTLDIEKKNIGGKAFSKEEHIWGFIAILRDLPSVAIFEANTPLLCIHLNREVSIANAFPALRFKRGKTFTVEQLVMVVQWAGAWIGGSWLIMYVEDCPLIQEDDPRLADAFPSLCNTS